LALLLVAATALAQTFEPYEGQPGKDVVWVPTRPALAEKMLDLGGVTARDFVIDLGSGDGRLVIAAAKRGARALGVEYEADMVALARRNAAAGGRALLHAADPASLRHAARARRAQNVGRGQGERRSHPLHAQLRCLHRPRARQ